MVYDATIHLPFDGSVIQALLASWQQQWPALGVMAFVPEKEKKYVAELQAIFRTLNIPLVGAIFPALLIDGDWDETGILLLRMNPHPPAFLFTDIYGQQAERAENMVRQLRPFIDTSAHAQPPALFMIFDGLVQGVSTIIDNLYLHLADSVHYAGVNAGCETFLNEPCLFDAWRCVRNGAWALLLPAWGTMLLEHGYTPPGKVISATSAQGNRIISIDWQPAFNVYKALVQEDWGVTLTAENFYQYASDYPLGILRANDQLVIRVPVGLNPDGSIVCVGDIPPNAALVLLYAKTSGNDNCIPLLCARMEKDLPPLSGDPLFTFYCAARRLYLGDETANELAALKNRTGTSTLVGALSLGETGSQRSWGAPLFHNTAVLCGSWKYR